MGFVEELLCKPLRNLVVRSMHAGRRAVLLLVMDLIHRGERRRGTKHKVNTSMVPSGTRIFDTA